MNRASRGRPSGKSNPWLMVGGLILQSKLSRRGVVDKAMWAQAALLGGLTLGLKGGEAGAAEEAKAPAKKKVKVGGGHDDRCLEWFHHPHTNGCVFHGLGARVIRSKPLRTV